MKYALTLPVCWMMIALLSACDGNSELMKHAISGDSQELKSSLDQSADIDARNNYGWTALMHAARNNHRKSVV